MRVGTGGGGGSCCVKRPQRLMVETLRVVLTDLFEGRSGRSLRSRHGAVQQRGHRGRVVPDLSRQAPCELENGKRDGVRGFQLRTKKGRLTDLSCNL